MREGGREEWIDGCGDEGGVDRLINERKIKRWLDGQIKGMKDKGEEKESREWREEEKRNGGLDGWMEGGSDG